MTFASVALVAQDAAAVASAEAAKPLFVEGRGAIALALLVVSAAIVGGILWARSGGRVTVRRMAGLDAVDEAVGRATEMGRPILYVPGIMDMDNIMTVAGVTILGHVARTVAEYDADLEVPTSRSIVMISARSAVQSAYLAAGRPEGYNPDRIYYISDEQFAYVAATSGMMARRRPAACFYFGCFFAESLILAENGNAIGAIQIAGTAETAQLPFFVAACDYTLIGEEFFAASAYLSGEPDQLGTLLGQDLAKAACWLAVIAAAAAGTVAALAGNESLAAGVAALRQAMGGGG